MFSNRVFLEHKLDIAETIKRVLEHVAGERELRRSAPQIVQNKSGRLQVTGILSIREIILHWVARCFRKKTEWKKTKRKTVKSRAKQKRLELLYENDVQSAPEIELPLNASAFAVFASVRLAVLDRYALRVL